MLDEHVSWFRIKVSRITLLSSSHERLAIIYVALIFFQKEVFYSLNFKSTHEYLLPLLLTLLLFKFCSEYPSTESSKGKFRYDHPIRMYFNSKTPHNCTHWKLYWRSCLCNLWLLLRYHSLILKHSETMWIIPKAQPRVLKLINAPSGLGSWLWTYQTCRFWPKS